MTLSDFIAHNRERIVDECEAFARTLLPVAGGMERKALRNDINEILAAVAADMDTAQSESQRSEKSMGRQPVKSGSSDSAATTHGKAREASGFDVNQAAAEYRALRASVIKLWLETSPSLGPEEVDQLTRFNEAMDQALAESLLRFSQQAAHSRDLFLGVLGHELRTPLATIVNSAQVLKLGGDAAQPILTETTDRILRGSGRIQSLLDDLLDFVRAGTGGGMRVTPTDMRMDTLGERIVCELEAAFPGRRIELRRQGDLAGRWDEQRIAQAVSNLVSNAIKYGAPDSPVTLSLTDTEDAHIAIEVHNAGREIPTEKCESLFEPLVRGTGPDATGLSLGLGLFIVREVARAHGGSVDVASSGQAGTVFCMTLPRHSEATRPSAMEGLRRT
ncbi:sensor histidine kinase [Lysobacter sp. D1-1-M9]|uniref:sensor histidine kinase n=2 Tax=Novilysobacter TaxID=3382699 RepID=UPI002FCAAD95